MYDVEYKKKNGKISEELTHLDRKKAYFLFISIVIIQPKEGKNYEKESMDIMYGNGSGFGGMQQCE